MSRIELAESFAEGAHAGQKRKYTGDAYITHPKAVADIVAEVTDDDSLVIAALLHDTIEDTPVEAEDITRLFGRGVTKLVIGMTQVSVPEDGNRAVRKAIDLAFLANQSADVKTIKLADMIHNSISIIEHDKRFARVYMAEMRQLIEVLRSGSSVLWDRANEVVEKYYYQTPMQKMMLKFADRYLEDMDHSRVFSEALPGKLNNNTGDTISFRRPVSFGDKG